jgi:hypothetical protein
MHIFSGDLLNLDENAVDIRGFAENLGLCA